MITTSRLLSDSSTAPPRLNVYLDLENLADLSSDTNSPELDSLSRYQRLMADGFEGVQLATDGPPSSVAPLPHCGLDHINTPAQADVIAARHAARGDLCLTVHAGWGLEEDADSYRLVEAILAAADQHHIPVFIETFRATITQDPWRTVRIAKRFPEARFNHDFSHYYCSQEIVNSDWASKFVLMELVLVRTGFMHGRIASSACIQMPMDSGLTARPLLAYGIHNYLDRFKELWMRAMLGFLRTALPGGVLIFAPELINGRFYYAGLFPDATGQLVEQSDRYARALLYKNLALCCLAEARRRFRKD